LCCVVLCCVVLCCVGLCCVVLCCVVLCCVVLCCVVLCCVVLVSHWETHCNDSSMRECVVLSCVGASTLFQRVMKKVCVCSASVGVLLNQLQREWSWLQHMPATHDCNTWLQHMTATHDCNTWLQHMTATHVVYADVTWFRMHEEQSNASHFSHQRF